MLEQEIARERALFFLINGSNSATLDHFMWLYSYKFTWIPFYICFIALFVYKYKKNWRECLMLFCCIAILIFFCDRITSGIIKPIFESFRPTHHPGYENLVHTVLGYRGGKYGFASSHAANAFGFGAFTSLLIRKRFYTVLIIFHSFITIYSRVYLGVHFIVDVAVGSLIGIVVALLIYRLYLFLHKQMIILKIIDNKTASLPVYTSKDVNYIAISYFATVILLLMFNNQLINILS